MVIFGCVDVIFLFGVYEVFDFGDVGLIDGIWRWYLGDVVVCGKVVDIGIFSFFIGFLVFSDEVKLFVSEREGGYFGRCV